MDETNLYEASLKSADLRDANLLGTNLSKANLYGATLSKAKYNNLTIWPEGFDPKAAGAILVEDEEKFSE